MAADQTLQSPGQQTIVILLGVGVSASHMCFIRLWCIWHLSPTSTVCKATVYCHCLICACCCRCLWRTLCCALFLSTQQHIRQQQQQQQNSRGWLNEGGITRLISLLPVTFFGIINSLPRFFGKLKLSVWICRLQTQCDLWYSPPHLVTAVWLRSSVLYM